MLMPDPTNQCSACGAEYVVLGQDPGVCRECGSRATTLVGETSVLDVRKQARLDTPARDAQTDDRTVLEVVVADETDRLCVVYVSGIESGSPEITTVRIDDTRIQAFDDHWSEELVPDCALWEVQERYGVLPTIAEQHVR